MSRIYSRHWKISSGHHNTAQIQHCPITTTFHMWVDYDVPNRFSTLKNFWRSPFSKWPPQYRTNSTLSDFNDISYVGRLWCPEFIPDIEKFLPVGHFQNGRHNTAKIQHCSISKVAFSLFFKPVVCGRFGRLHYREIISYLVYFTGQGKWCLFNNLGQNVILSKLVLI